MKYIDILTAFETEIGVINNVLDKPASDDSLYWLNQAVDKFVKTRFNGDQVHNTGYEQTEKRRSDLIKLFSQHHCPFSKTLNENPSYDEYLVEYPSDFLYVLNEDVVICDTNGEHEMNTCVFECTQDSFMYRVNNSLTDFHYRFHRARPLRIRIGTSRTDKNVQLCKLLTDGNYEIEEYTLGYIRKPKEITLENPFNEYEDFEDSTMHEIIKIAAQMYLENKPDERYKTITQEVLTQE